MRWEQAFSRPSSRCDRKKNWRPSLRETRQQGHGILADTEISDAWKELGRLVDDTSAEPLNDFLAHLPPGELPLAVSRLSDEQQSQLFSQLAPEQAAWLLGQLVDAQAVDVLETLEPTAAAAILDELPSNEQADLIGDLDDEEAEAILREMDPVEAADARALIPYDDDVAGGLMATEFLRFRQHATVADVVDDMRQNADEYRDYDVQYAYVCDQDDRLTGVLRLRDLVTGKTFGRRRKTHDSRPGGGPSRYHAR